MHLRILKFHSTLDWVLFNRRDPFRGVAFRGPKVMDAFDICIDWAYRLKPRVRQINALAQASIDLTKLRKKYRSYYDVQLVTQQHHSNYDEVAWGR